MLTCFIFGMNSAQGRETLEQKNEALVSWVEEKISPTREWLEKHVKLAEQWVQRHSEKVKSDSTAVRYPVGEAVHEVKSSQSDKGILHRVNREEFDKAVEKVKRNYDGVILSVKRLDLETVKYKIKILLHSGKIKTVSVDGESPEQALENKQEEGTSTDVTDVIAVSRGERGVMDVKGAQYR